MLANQNKLFPRSARQHTTGGFTLVELMVGLVVTAIVTLGIFSTYDTTRKTVMAQRQVADLQQQLRGAMYIMARDIRSAGFDPTGIGTPAAPLGIQDVRKYNIVVDPGAVGPADLNANGSPGLTVDFDLDSDGVKEQSIYLLYDVDADGITDLARSTDNGATFDLLAEGIQAIGFAYAIDNDLDGKLDTTAAGNTIWAVDTDNDNKLDANLDGDDDGNIDADDFTAGVTPLAAGPVTLDRIRMVRIWLLGRSTRQAKVAMVDKNSYVVGAQLIPAANDNFRRRLLEMSFRGRNLGL